MCQAKYCAIVFFFFICSHIFFLLHHQFSSHNASNCCLEFVFGFTELVVQGHISATCCVILCSIYIQQENIARIRIISTCLPHHHAVWTGRTDCGSCTAELSWAVARHGLLRSVNNTTPCGTDRAFATRGRFWVFFSSSSHHHQNVNWSSVQHK